MITVEKYFDDEDYTLSATFDVDTMASAIGCPEQYASRFAGQYAVEIHECVNVETGKEHAPTSFEYETLTAACMKKIQCSRR